MWLAWHTHKPKLTGYRLCHITNIKAVPSYRAGGQLPPPPPQQASLAIVTNNAYTASYLVIFELSAVSCHNSQHTNFRIQQETNSVSANLIENTL